MKYIISKEQHGEIMEGPFDSFKNRMEYHLNVGDRKKYPGKPTYSMYVMMKAYQEIIDRVFKYAEKEFPYEGVKGLLVATAFSRGSIMNGPENITITLWPVLDENNPFKGTQEEFDENTKKFSDVLKKNIERRQLHKFWPLDREKRVKNHFHISPTKVSTVMLESHPEFWEHNLFIKRRLDMINEFVIGSYAYQHPCEYFSAESFVFDLINNDIHHFLTEENFSEGEILDVKDFIDDYYKEKLISYWRRKCAKSVVKEGYIPANFVKRRLPELENVVYMAMNSHDDERDFHDFVERCFEYVFSYYSDHSTLPRDYIEELVDYVGEYMFPILEKHFLEVRSMENDKPDIVSEGKIDEYRENFLGKLHHYDNGVYVLFDKKGGEGDPVLEYDNFDGRLWIQSDYLSLFYGMFGFESLGEAAEYIERWFENKFGYNVKDIVFSKK